MDKEYIIKGLKSRILSEYMKHSSQLDWAEIAARKIYASYDINRKDIKVENK